MLRTRFNIHCSGFARSTGAFPGCCPAPYSRARGLRANFFGRQRTEFHRFWQIMLILPNLANRSIAGRARPTALKSFEFNHIPAIPRSEPIGVHALVRSGLLRSWNIVNSLCFPRLPSSAPYSRARGSRATKN